MAEKETGRVDAFTSLARAREATELRHAAGDVRERLFALCATYRTWSLVHPVEFELISGRPFPGIFRCFSEAHRCGRLVIPGEYRALPPAIAEGSAAWRRQSGIEMPGGLVALLVDGWAGIHGMVLLEMHGHTRPLLGDPAAFCRLEIEAFPRWMGMEEKR